MRPAVSASPISPNPAPTARLPGIALAATVAAAAFAIKAAGFPIIASFSPLMLAILIGMAVRNLWGRPEAARAGLAAALRTPLRLGIVLLGLQVLLLLEVCYFLVVHFFIVVLFVAVELVHLLLHLLLQQLYLLTEW